MQVCWLVISVLLLPIQTYLATASGQILDREGNPLAGALVTYTNIGIVHRNYQLDHGMMSESPEMVEGTGRVYQVKTDKKGVFTLSGVDYGIYQVEISGPDGSHVYSGRKTVGDSSDPNSQNVLNVDLSSMIRGPVVPGNETNLAAGKKTKEQLELIRQENAHASKINRLIAQYQTAIAIQDWTNAIPLVQRLIALDPNRWEFYQNLGTLQSNQMQYQEAAQSFAKGVEVAKKILANPSDSDRALTSIGGLLLAEADCYSRMEKVDEAAALYEKAASVYPHPFMAHYRACNLLTNYGKTDAAIEACTRAIADGPTQWGPYQVLGGLFTSANRPKDALKTYEKGIATAQETLEERPDAGPAKTGLGQMLNSEGNLLVQLKQYDGAIAAFTRAASLSLYPATPYFNLCATYYNLKREQEALAACEQTISSDPNMADAYYIKGSILFGKGHVEHGKYVVPPGTIESLKKYLENAP
ncbi:MAG TPA: tetratricopeptide repeat protein, partial [Candidatus Limnocylindrales bacterium]|nr:tetratricopeptide repeat protein [Candidatus Limnocylindrales bacterium]